MYQERIVQLKKQTDLSDEHVEELLYIEAEVLQNTIANRHGIPLVERPTQEFHAYMRHGHRNAVERRKRHNRYLESCKKELGPPCPCSDPATHYSITFVNADEEKVENLCPRHWWIKLVTLKHEQEEATNFVETMPVGKYMEGYKI